MDKLLSTIESPRDLAGLSTAQLEQLAAEMREALCSLLTSRSAHFASNLGVVELCLALHTTFDFSRDRLIWDTGHQIYPHKLITGRYHEFGTIRTKGGLMGYPNPDESEYDLFMTGHAGCSVSTALGLKSGDDLIPGQEDRHSVAVIGDGAFPSGIVYEAMNNAGDMRKKLLVVLNDNQMSICPRVGGMGEYLDRLRIEFVLHRAEERSAQDSQQGAAVRRSGGTPAGAGQRGGQGRLARRHAVRGTRLSLYRPGRRPQHSAALQISDHGQGRGGTGAACTS